MRRKISYYTAIFIAVLQVGCFKTNAGVTGSGVTKSETRTVSFKSLKLNLAADVNITPGEKSEVTITTDDNILPLIKTSVIDGTLSIDSSESYNSKSGVKISITVPDISSVILNGVGNVVIDKVPSDSLDVQLVGTGNITAKGTSPKLTAALSGVGNLN